MEISLNLYNFVENTNNNIKNSIISLIYQELNINSFRYQMLDHKSLDVIKKETSYITPHIIGSNCWIIFCELSNVKYQAIIYKRDLKQHRNQMVVNQFKLFTFQISQELNNNLYPLTVFDGKFIINNIDNVNKLAFLIQDMYIYGGEKMLNKNLPDKVKMIEQILPSLNNGLDQNFSIKLCGIYTFEQMGDLIFNKIKKSKLKINGFIFLPEKSGKTYLFINDNDFNLLRNNTPNELVCKKYSSLSVPSIPLQMSHKNQLDVHLIDDFVLRKTNIADVFEIYKYNTNETKLYLNIDRNNYVGICHIPDIKTSHYCKMMGDKHEIFVNKCNYNYKFKKWTPIIN